MGWDPPNKIKYLYKRIRFGRIEGESKRFKVFTIVNPVGASKVITTSLKTENCEYICTYIFSKVLTIKLFDSVYFFQPPSYLQRWDPKSYTIEQAIPIEGSLSALATSDNGNFVATGSMFDGTVEIYTAFNLVVSV